MSDCCSKPYANCRDNQFFRLISCDVLLREMCWAVSQSPHRVDPEFLPKGLHDIGAEKMLAEMQAAVDRVPAGKYNAILLGYALCSNGIVGLQARHTPIVLPKAHDCITLFLGSRAGYTDYFNNNPGTYFATSGWLERGGDAGDLQSDSIGHQVGMDNTYEELVRKYGEDNAQFLYEQLCASTRNYGQLTYIKMGVEAGDQYEQVTRKRAEAQQWKFDCVQGNMDLIQRLVGGQWEGGDFLVIQPGYSVKRCYDDEIVGIELTPA